MHIALFGKNGQLGKELQKKMDQAGLPYTAFGAEECDITDYKKVEEILTPLQPTHVINATAYNLVDKAEQEETEIAYAVNHLAVSNMAKVAHSVHARLLHVSTDYVFAGNTTIPLTEEDGALPLSHYGKSKLGGEEAVLSYPEHSAFRTSWLYGDGTQNFIYKFLKNVETNAGVLKGTYDEISIPTSTEVLADILLCAVQKNISGLFHATCGGEASRAEWAREILKIKGIDRMVEELSIQSWNLPAARPHYSVMSNEKIQNALGKKLPHWKEELKRIIEKYY